MYRYIAYNRGKLDIVEMGECDNFKVIYNCAIYDIKSGIVDSVDIYTDKDYSKPKYELHIVNSDIMLVRLNHNISSYIVYDNVFPCSYEKAL